MQSSSSPLKILWMIPKWTLPATDGARVATDSLVRNTVAAGAEVDILCLPQKFETTDVVSMKQSWGVKNVFILKRDVPEGAFLKKLYFLKSLLTNPLTPLTFASFSTSHIKKEVQNYISAGTYDYILLDGLHLGSALMKNGKFNLSTRLPKVIYRAHNIEVDLWIKAFKEKRSPLMKLTLYIQAFLVGKLEHSIIQQISGVAAIAQEDLDVIKKMSSSNSRLVPLGLNFDSPVAACTKQNTNFLFLGRLDWPPNKDGLEWVLKEVWPTVVANRPDAILKIVGSGNRDWLKKYQHLRGIRIVGFVDSVFDAYRDCHFTVVPVFYGSGTRIKVLESFAMSRRLISTKMGVQGADLGQQDYVNAETKLEWINILSSISLDEEQQNQLDRSRLEVASKFSEKKIGAMFYDWLKTIL
jgi:glycosyltransferase involved in cell wall biosynthesis